MLQFTVQSTVLIDSSDETEYHGKAVELSGSFLDNENQPEHDDGQISPNGAASSSAAQVSYFLRSGRLYRRVVLLRDPWESGGDQPLQTFPGPPVDYFDHSSSLILTGNQYARRSGAAGEFWEDFDFAAYASSGAKFLGMDSLHNDGSTGTQFFGPQEFELSLGIPRFRFGFDQATGISREFSHFDPGTSGAYFLGRYTHEETSHPNFNFPQTGSNPFSYAVTPVDTNLDEVVDAFANGPRRGEDLLLSHVHSFEILVWDTRMGAFVPLGHSLTDASGFEGDFHINRNRQLAAGLTVVPGDPAAFTAAGWHGHVFDTWHSTIDFDNADMDDNNSTGQDPPPYRPLVYYPSRSGYRTPLKPDWATGAVYESEDANRNGRLDPGEDAANAKWPVANGRLDGDIVFPTGTTGNFDLYYECVLPGTAGSAASDEPIWPQTKGGKTLRPIGGEPQFVAVPNIVPLSSIQIRVRFLHVPSNKIRQLTLVHSLVDKPL